ncbi:MAG: hypothetical protein ABF479_01255 [Gluconacetobacter sp.]
MSDTTQTPSPEDLMAARQAERGVRAASLQRLTTQSRKGIFYFLGICVLLAIGISALGYLTRSHEEHLSDVAAGPKMTNTAGGTNVTARIKKDYREADSKDAREAESNQQSYTPELGGVATQPPPADARLPGETSSQTTPPPTDPAPHDVTPTAPKPIGKDGRGDGSTAADPFNASPAPDPAAVGNPPSEQAPGLSRSAEAEVFAMWSRGGWGLEKGDISDHAQGGNQTAGTNASPAPYTVTGDRGDMPDGKAAGTAAAAHETTPPSGKGRTLLPAGRGVYAVTVTASNSDQSGTPVIADVVSGPFTDARLIGSFQRQEDRLIVKFNQLVIGKDDPISVNAIALSPATMETAVASDVNEHYVTRIVLPAGAAFVQSLGQAMQSTNTQSYTAGLGVSSFTHLSLPQQLGVAAGGAGQALGEMIQKATPQQDTVTLNAREGIGVIFLSPVVAKE